MSLSRRSFVQLAGSSLLLQSQLLKAESSLRPGIPGVPAQAPGPAAPAKVALAYGNDRRKNVRGARKPSTRRFAPGYAGRSPCSSVNVSTENQLAATHLDALQGILDYLEPRFHGPIVIGESSAGDTLEGFEHFGYNRLASERRAQREMVALVDLNREAKYGTVEVLDADLHITPVRLAARVLDPETFVISSAMLKHHNTVVATMTVKNMVLGSPLHSVPGEIFWSDKRKYHVGIRQTHYNMLVTAQKLQPHWGLALIDGFEGMEGNGPGNGTQVASHVAIASTDFIAADRVGLEVMGIDPDWVGYLAYCGQAGLGQYDLTKIQVDGVSIASVAKKYQLHPQIQKELEWMGPLQQGSPTMGSLLAGDETYPA